MLRAVVVLVLAALVPAVPACKSPEPTGPEGSSGGAVPQGKRMPVVPRVHDLYNRFEGTTFKNDCVSDSGCFRAGCSGEICSAANDVMGTCEALPVQLPQSANCGCVENECIWWSSDGATLVAADPGTEPRSEDQPPGGACGDKTCAVGEQCIEYYGVAGPRGPKFQSCGIPCKAGKCPDGKKCVTIADGPGPVCQ